MPASANALVLLAEGAEEAATEEEEAGLRGGGRGIYAICEDGESVCP